MNEDTDFIIYRLPTLTPGDTLTNIIYSGKILAGYSLLHINELLAQYVYTEDLVIDASHIIQDDEQYYKFFLYTTTDDWDTFTSDTITVIYDWSYEYDAPNIRPIKSSIPINLIDYRQFAIQSMMSRDGTTEVIQAFLNSGSSTQTIDNFAIDSSSTWTYFRWLNDGVIAWPTEFITPYYLNINGIRYEVTSTCYEYCLYYLNQWGGYDYMLFGGRELQTDNLSRLSYNKHYTNNSKQFGQVDYQTTIKETWSLNTSWMTDTQADKLKHLFSSNKIWMQILSDPSKQPHLIPVNITNTTYEHKTSKNQGHKLFAYDIEVKASQTKYRI